MAILSKRSVLTSSEMPKNVPRFIPSSQQEMESRYLKAKTNPGYSRLRQTAKVIGTWDDHDFGLNDAGKEVGGKVTNQRFLLDFLYQPQDSPCEVSGLVDTGNNESNEQKLPI